MMNAGPALKASLILAESVMGWSDAFWLKTCHCLFVPFRRFETLRYRTLLGLDLGHAAIDIKLCARDIAGLIGREE